MAGERYWGDGEWVYPDPKAGHVRMRTDSGYCGWWCDRHERFTGKRDWCPMCDDAPDYDSRLALPLHRTEAGYPNCSTCDGGGCLDCTDPA